MHTRVFLDFVREHLFVCGVGGVGIYRNTDVLMLVDFFVFVLALVCLFRASMVSCLVRGAEHVSNRRKATYAFALE